MDLDPRQLAAHAIGIDEVASAVQNANVSLPTGTMYGPEQTFTVLANGQLQRRPDELQLLRQPEFVRACADAGFTLIAPAQLRTLPLSRRSHAA